MTEPAQSPELARLPEFEKAVLRVKELSLWYGATQALKEISLDVPERKITALIGPSVPELSDRPLWWYGIGGGIVVAGGLLYWRLRSRHASRRRVEGRSKSRSGGSTRAKGKSHG